MASSERTGPWGSDVTLRLVIAVACAAVWTATARADNDALAAFVEAERARESVPGVSVTVIRGHRIAWSRGFGLADTLNRDPVTPDTAFPAASNAKPIAAWLVTQLATQGAIALDEPVRSQAAVALPDTADHNAITPRHLLSHSSGLGNFLRDTARDLAFKPGEGFAYSGVGFMVLQELLEAKTHQSLDAHARTALFAPLGMRRSWFAAPQGGSIAAPHVSLIYALVPFAIAGGAALIGTAIIALIASRLWTGRGRAGRALVISAAIAPVAAIAVFLYLSGSPAMTLWFVAVPLVVLAPLIAAALAARKSVLTAAAIALVWGAAFFAFRNAHLPLPAGPAANAASSLYASAPDLARFLIELAQPTLGDTAATREMGTVQVRIDDVAAWGLGIGVETHAKGRDLWQWGSNPGAKSLMIISPETGDGVVILTNGEVDGAFTRRIAARILGREGCWRAGCE